MPVSICLMKEACCDFERYEICLGNYCKYDVSTMLESTAIKVPLDPRGTIGRSNSSVQASPQVPSWTCGVAMIEKRTHTHVEPLSAPVFDPSMQSTGMMTLPVISTMMLNAVKAGGKDAKTLMVPPETMVLRIEVNCISLTAVTMVLMRSMGIRVIVVRVSSVMGVCIVAKAWQKNIDNIRDTEHEHYQQLKIGVF